MASAQEETKTSADADQLRSPKSARTLLGWSEKRSIGAPAAGTGPASGAAVDGPGSPVSAAATRGLVVHRSRTNCDTGARDPSLNRLWNGGRRSARGAADVAVATASAAAGWACRDGGADARSSGGPTVSATAVLAGPPG